MQVQSKEWAASDGGVLFGSDTLGVHAATDGSETLVRAVGSSHGTRERLLATGDEYQQLRLMRYPCTAPVAIGGPCCTGHASALSAVRFSFNDRHVLTAGGEDLTIFVWRLQGAAAAPTASTAASGETGATATAATAGAAGATSVAGEVGPNRASIEEEDEGEDEDEDSDVEVDLRDLPAKDKGRRAGGGEDDEDEDEDEGFTVADPMAGDQLGSVKPWQASIFAPTNAPPLDSTPPDETLRLDWVYGFRGFDTRRAALWLGGGGDGSRDGAIVYPAASVVVSYDPATHTQSYFLEHKDDVLGLAVHRERGLIASSQKAYREGGRTRKPTIWVSSATGAWAPHGPLVLTACNQRWVSLLCFNTSGDLLCSVGNDNDNSLVLWDWKKGVALCAVPTHKDRLFACRCGALRCATCALSSPTSQKTG